MFTYCSVLCTNYPELFKILVRRRVAFEWHPKNGRSYVDFILDSERHPLLGEIVAEVEEQLSRTGKHPRVRVVSTYEMKTIKNAEQ